MGRFRVSFYVVNRGDDTVSVIDIAAGNVIAIPVGNSPRWVAITPDGSFAFVTNYGSGNLSVIDTLSNTVVYTVSVSRRPFGIAITPNGTKAYVTLPDDDKVAVVEILGTGGAVLLGFVDVGTEPGWVAITPDGTSAFVTNYKSDDVSVLNVATDTVTKTIKLGVGVGPCGVAITPDGVNVYLATNITNDIIQIAVNNLNWNICNDPQLLAVAGPYYGVGIAALTPTRFHVYVTDVMNDGGVVIADRDFKFWGLFGGGPPGPSAVAVTPDGAYVYVTCTNSDQVAVIDTKNIQVDQGSGVRSVQVVGFIKVGKQPFGIAIRA